MVREIPLTRGMVALVDDADHPYLSQFNWHAKTNGHNWYAVRNSSGGGLNRKRIKMHREIVDAQPGQLVDHRDGDSLNCTRANLRIATHMGNVTNRPKRADSMQPFKGVSQSGRLWYAKIKHGPKRITSSGFATPEEAALEYDRMAREAFGEFACLNFPVGNERAAA